MKPIVATLYTADLSGKPFRYTYLYSDAAHAAISIDSSFEVADAQCVAAGRPDLVGKFGSRGKLGFAPAKSLVADLSNPWNAQTALEINGESFIVTQKGFDPVRSFTLAKVQSDGRAIPVVTGPIESIMSRLAAL